VFSIPKSDFVEGGGGMGKRESGGRKERRERVATDRGDA